MNKYLSPIQDKVPPIESPTEDLPFSPSLSMIVKVPNDPKGHAEIYIDDFIVTVVDINNNASRANKAVSLAIHTIGRPLLS